MHAEVREGPPDFSLHQTFFLDSTSKRFIMQGQSPADELILSSIHKVLSQKYSGASTDMVERVTLV